MTDALDKTVTLIRKLLALANDDGAGEHEAALALSKAQQLMQNANLTFAALEARGETTEGSRRTKEGIESRTPYAWHRKLMVGIARLNSVWCEVRFRKLAHTRAFDGYDLIGREANIASTRVMHEYLLQAVERVARAHVGGDAAKFFTKYAHQFKDGCADRLVERMQDRHDQLLTEQEREARETKARQSHPSYLGGNALVVVMRDYYATEDDLNNDMRNGWDPGTTANNRADMEARYQAQKVARESKLAAILVNNPGIDETVADWMAGGWDRQRAEEVIFGTCKATETHKPAKPETEAQRKKRESRERAQEERNWRQYMRNQKGEGYHAGKQAGNDIGLDRQASHDKKARLS